MITLLCVYRNRSVKSGGIVHGVNLVFPLSVQEHLPSVQMVRIFMTVIMEIGVMIVIWIIGIVMSLPTSVTEDRAYQLTV